MKEKYYTPEIEEFCVGFEVQILNEENGMWGTLFKCYEKL